MAPRFITSPHSHTPLDVHRRQHVRPRAARARPPAGHADHPVQRRKGREAHHRQILDERPVDGVFAEPQGPGAGRGTGVGVVEEVFEGERAHGGAAPRAPVEGGGGGGGVGPAELEDGEGEGGVGVLLVVFGGEGEVVYVYIESVGRSVEGTMFDWLVSPIYLVQRRGEQPREEAQVRVGKGGVVVAGCVNAKWGFEGGGYT